MELVEGETLAELLRRGPIAVEEVLKVALQIADALEAARFGKSADSCRALDG